MDQERDGGGGLTFIQKHFELNNDWSLKYLGSNPYLMH